MGQKNWLNCKNIAISCDFCDFLIYYLNDLHRKEGGFTKQFENTIVVTGHYGSGKTNLSLNLAMDYRRQGREVVLADLDVVNPYFRTADFRDYAAQQGIQLIASDYAGSALDVPAVSGRLDAHIGGDTVVIIDVGGDDAGAMAVGRFSARLQETGYSMLYVISAYRYLVKEPSQTVKLLREIEAASRLTATCIANCSNLGSETTTEDIRRSMSYAEQVVKLTGLPLCFTAVRRDLASELRDLQDVYPVEIYVTAPWNEAL